MSACLQTVTLHTVSTPSPQQVQGVLRHANAGRPHRTPLQRSKRFTSGHLHVRVPGGGNMRSRAETVASNAARSKLVWALPTIASWPHRQPVERPTGGGNTLPATAMAALQPATTR